MTPDNAAIIAELTRVRCDFQLRAITAALCFLPEPRQQTANEDGDGKRFDHHKDASA